MYYAVGAGLTAYQSSPIFLYICRGAGLAILGLPPANSELVALVPLLGGHTASWLYRSARIGFLVISIWPR